MTVTYEGREVEAVLLVGKHYDSTMRKITTENCCDSQVLDWENVTVNEDGSLFFNDIVHNRKLFIDTKGNVYQLNYE